MEIRLFGKPVRLETTDTRIGHIAHEPDGSATVYIPRGRLGNEAFLREVRFLLFARSLPDPRIAYAALLNQPHPAERLAPLVAGGTTPNGATTSATREEDDGAGFSVEGARLSSASREEIEALLETLEGHLRRWSAAKPRPALRQDR